MPACIDDEKVWRGGEVRNALRASGDESVACRHGLSVAQAGDAEPLAGLDAAGQGVVADASLDVESALDQHVGGGAAALLGQDEARWRGEYRVGWAWIDFLVYGGSYGSADRLARDAAERADEDAAARWSRLAERCGD